MLLTKTQLTENLVNGPIVSKWLTFKLPIGPSNMENCNLIKNVFLYNLIPFNMKDRQI